MQNSIEVRRSAPQSDDITSFVWLSVCGIKHSSELQGPARRTHPLIHMAQIYFPDCFSGVNLPLAHEECFALAGRSANLPPQQFGWTQFFVSCFHCLQWQTLQSLSEFTFFLQTNKLSRGNRMVLDFSPFLQFPTIRKKLNFQKKPTCKQTKTVWIGPLSSLKSSLKNTHGHPSLRKSTNKLSLISKLFKDWIDVFVS